MTGILFLILGFLAGSALSELLPWSTGNQNNGDLLLQLTPAGSGSSSQATQEDFLDSKDNFPLLSTACAVVRALKEQDYALLSSYVDPDRGVTFTPYSTVDFTTDLNFSAQQIGTLATDNTKYAWGFQDGIGTVIELTMAEYFDAYVFDADYTQANQIGIDRIVISGNALENLNQAYSGCRFVDFCFPGAQSDPQGLEWHSLKLVFRPGESQWYLVGIVHGEWTI